MKIRTGFVSNSSSSSFCIIGQQVDNDKPLIVDKKVKYMIHSGTEEFCGDSGAILVWVDHKFAEWLNSPESAHAKEVMDWGNCKIYRLIIEDSTQRALTVDEAEAILAAVKQNPVYVKSGECDQHGIYDSTDLKELIGNR